MSVQGPWYITVKAVQDYLRIKRKPVTSDGPEFERAERELIAMAIRAHAQDPKTTASGMLQYRGPKPAKLSLTVNPEPRAEGDLPQLVGVSRPAPGRALTDKGHGMDGPRARRVGGGAGRAGLPATDYEGRPRGSRILAEGQRDHRVIRRNAKSPRAREGARGLSSFVGNFSSGL